MDNHSQSDRSTYIFSMWKCVVVGLALVLPGFLLNVEGRYSEGDRGARQGLLEMIRDLYRQDQLLNAERDSGNNGQALEKKFNSAGAVADSDGGGGDAQAEDGDGGGGGGGGPGEPAGPDLDSAPPPAPPRLQEAAHGSLGKEVNLQAAEAAPQALGLSQEDAQQRESPASGSMGVTVGSIGFIMIVAGCSVLAAVGIVGAGVCWYKYNRAAKATSEVEYPAYGVTGPTKDRLPSPGDRKLAQSAQMYHYQHQKQQMIAMEKANGDMKHDASDDESEEDTAEGDYTVYECPGLAPTGEMEVKNPLFRGDETPSTPQGEGDHQGN